MVLKVVKKKLSAGKHAGVGKDLLKIEERYQRLVELSPDMIALHSNGKYIYMNPAGLRILGSPSQEEIIGKPVSEVIHPESREVVKSRIRQLEDGEDVPPIEEKFLRLDGTIVDVEVTAAPIPSRGKPMIQVLARDITKRKQTEEALKQTIDASQRLAFEKMIMAEIGQIVSSTLDIEEVYKLFSEKVKTLLPYDRIAINLINKDGVTLINRYVEGESAPGRNAGEHFPVGGNLNGNDNQESERAIAR